MGGGTSEQYDAIGWLAGFVFGFRRDVTAAQAFDLAGSLIVRLTALPHPDVDDPEILRRRVQGDPRGLGTRTAHDQVRRFFDHDPRLTFELVGKIVAAAHVAAAVV